MKGSTSLDLDGGSSRPSIRSGVCLCIGPGRTCAA